MSDQGLGVQVRENLLRVEEQIAEAVLAARRPAGAVTLVGVTKYVGVAETAALLTAGCKTIGESRPQQLWAKAEEPTLAGADWHLIGHLQRNKAERTVPLVGITHGVDSQRLLAQINQQGASCTERPRLLLEVNCSGDPTKHGFTPDQLRRLVSGLDAYPGLKVCGLMTMAAREGGPSVARRNFAQLRELREEVSQAAPPGVELTELSMGMSADFAEAIREGSTLVRIGSALWEGVNHE